MRPLLFIVFAALVLALWLGLSAFQSEDGPAFHLPDETTATPLEKGAQDASSRTLPGRGLVHDPAHEHESKESGPTPFHPKASRDSLLFQFLSAEGREPVPGVRVYFLRDKPDPTEARFFTQFIMEKGEVFQADEYGELRLPRGPELGRLMAMGEGLWGEGVILPVDRGPLDEPARIYLKKIEVVQVRVLTKEGEPLESLPLVWKAHRDGGGSDVLLRMKTDENGTVVMPVPDELTLRPVVCETISVEGLFPEPIFQTVDRKDLPRMPLELRLPDCSPLQFEITAPEELRAASGGIMIALGRDLTLVEFHARGIMIPIVQGKAHFPWIGSNLPVMVQAGVDRQLGYKRLDIQAESSPRSGEARLVELKFDPKVREPYIHGTLRGPRAEILTGLNEIEINYEWLEGSTEHGRSSRSVQLDAESNFGYRESTRTGLKDVCDVRIDIPSWQGLSYTWENQVVPADNGDMDLGEIHLQEVPLILEGRVVNAEGQGIAEAMVIVCSRTAGTEEVLGFQPNNVVGRTDDNGRFRLFSRDQRNNLCVKVIAGDYGTIEQDVRPGETDLLLQIKPPSRLRVLIMAANRESLSGLNYELSSVQGLMMNEALPDHGLLRLELVPGQYHLRLYDGVDPDLALLDLRDIQLTESKTTNLGTKKLDRKLRKVEVEVLGLETLSAAERAEVEVIAYDIATSKIVGKKALSPEGCIRSLWVSGPQVELSLSLGQRQSPPIRETSPKTILTLPK